MNAEFLKIAGQVAGIGGLAIGTFLILFRDVIRKNIFPNLTKDQAYKLLRLIVILVWSVAIVGIAAWTYATTSADKNDRASQKPPSPNGNYGPITKYEVTGQVRDEMGGLPDADILDVNSGARTSSDREGMFTLEVKETNKGWVRIQAVKEGYEIWEEYVETKPGLIISLRRKQK